MSRKFKEYYEMKTVGTGKDARQVPVYIGDYHRFAVADTVRVRYAAIFFMLSLLNMGLFISSGMLNGIFSRIIFITVPYAIQFLPAMFLISSSFGFLRSRGDMTIPEYISKFRKIRTMGYINIFMSLVAAIESVLVFLYSTANLGADEVLFIVFTVLIVIILVIMLYLHKIIEKSVEIIKGNQIKIQDGDL
ncbi:MAG: hypothetical protein ACYCYM_09255 [Saccharofermentanales bacterium]